MSTPTPLNIESFSFLPATKLPALTLSIPVPLDALRSDFTRFVTPRFNTQRTWKKVAHQCGGTNGSQKYFFSTILTPTPVASEGIRQISSRWKNSALGAPGTTLTQLAGYRVDVKRYLGVDVDEAYSQAAEGCYTFDLKYLRRLTTEVLPQDFDELLQFETGWERAAMAGRWLGAFLV